MSDIVNDVRRLTYWWKRAGEAEQERQQLKQEIEALQARLGSCTGYINDRGTISHDGDTCPVHEDVT